MRILLLLALAAGLVSADLLHASFDPTRELFQEINARFEARRRAAGDEMVVRMSHGGSGKQARSVIEGLEADVVSLAIDLDVDRIAAAGLLDRGWKARQPGGASPWTSTIVFLVRQGNPKRITGWADLARADVAAVTANPKTSGGARLVYLAAWTHAVETYGTDQAAIDAYMRGWLTRVPTFDAGARGAATTFVRRGMGDVLLTWENEAQAAALESKGRCEVVVPALSILAEPPVAMLDDVVRRKGTAAVAGEYLAFLRSEEVQEIAARHHLRPRSPEVLARHRAHFPDLRLVTVDQAFGGWDAAQRTHFDDGGTFDRLAAR